MDIKSLIEYTVRHRASDLHLIVGRPPMIRVNGFLAPITGQEVLTPQAVEELVTSLVNQEQKEILLVNKEIDFSYVPTSGDPLSVFNSSRFRVNAYYQKGTLAAALRLINNVIPSIDQLGLPDVCHQATKLMQGLILVTGPTGHGKSTSLAAMIEEINQDRPAHVITVEDPIEYVLTQKKAIISQREMKMDTHSWEIALRSCLREDPDVVMVGEMRDYETIAATLTIAETGHLVFATLHTNSAAQTIDRIVDVFPENQQMQVRMQLSFTLEMILSQRLLPTIDNSRVPACEILLSTPAIKTAIREGKSHLIDNMIQTSTSLGMKTLEMDLARLIKAGRVSMEVARDYAFRPDELAKLVAKA
jgi:twitching motility protein PilT